MGSVNKVTKPTRYIVQVAGHLDPLWEHRFEGVKITPTDESVTILSVEVKDQSALYGLLETIHSLNLILLSVQRIDLHD